MTFEQIESFITQFPIYQYAFVTPDESWFSDKVRAICKQECPRYGTTWSCPPALGSLSSCKAHCLQYPHALFFSSVAEVKDSMDMAASLKTKQEHEKMTSIIENEVRKSGVPVFTLSTDSCSACERCTCPRRPCLHPELMHPCIEGYGIVVPNLIEANNMDYFIGNRYIIWFSLMFFGDDKKKGRDNK